MILGVRAGASRSGITSRTRHNPRTPEPWHPEWFFHSFEQWEWWDRKASTPAGTATKHSKHHHNRQITHHARRVALRHKIPDYLPFISSLRSPAQLPPGAEMVPASWKLNVP
jgi:hypothetical protein